MTMAILKIRLVVRLRPRISHAMFGEQLPQVG